MDSRREEIAVTYGSTSAWQSPAMAATLAKAADGEDGGEDCSPGWRFWRRRRYVVAAMAFLGFFNVYALRVNLSVAIVAMTTASNVTLANGTTVLVPAEFEWDPSTRGLILSTFFYGYIVTQVPGGWLASRVGGARVYGVGLAATALLTIVTPPLAKAGMGWLIAIRVIEGLFEGVTYPCIHAIWAHWAPPAERSRLATIAFSGSYAGTVVSLPLSGFLAATLGWPAIFYIFGIAGLIWYGFWVSLVKESPAEDPNVSPAELRYIQKALSTVADSNKSRPPWGSFFKSMPVWAIVMAHFSENWGFYTLLTQLPSFMQDVLHVQIEQSGLLSALPYVCLSVILQAAGYFADWLRAGRMSTTAVRKLFNCGAFLSQTTFMIIAIYMTSPWAIVLCLTIAVGLGGFAWSAFSVNHLDIAPQYASILMGISNTVATLPGMISPIITGYIVNDKIPSRWHVVFFLSSAIYLVGALFYGTFASGDRQPWAQEAAKFDVDVDSKPKTNRNTHTYTNEALDIQSEEP